MTMTALTCGQCDRLVCFFFQAEDGIRDVAVTGVQTCALPILQGGTVADHAMLLEEGRHLGVAHGAVGGGSSGRNGCSSFGTGRRRRSGLGTSRSEERRVGKEGRSRWSPDH